jgi:hypothetical protein
VWIAGVIFGSLATGNQMSSLDNALPFLQYDKLVHYGANASIAITNILGVLSAIALGSFAAAVSTRSRQCDARSGRLIHRWQDNRAYFRQLHRQMRTV